MANVSSKNLQVRLLILVFLAFVPALWIFWYANRELRDLQLQAKQEDLEQRVAEVATDYEHLIQKGESVLGVLSEFDEIRSVRFPECTEYLGRALEHASELTTISVIGMDGNLACGSITPETLLYLGDRAYFVRATSRGVFSTGDFSLGRLTGKPVVGLALPLPGGERPGGVIAASIDLNALGSAAESRGLPEGYTFSVLDLRRRVMVRLPRSGDFTLADSVGAVADTTFPGLSESGNRRVVVGWDLDGIERLFAIAPLRSPGGRTQGYAAVGRTRVTLMHEVDAIVGRQLRFLAVGGIVLLAMAWALGHFWLVRQPSRDPGGESLD